MNNHTDSAHNALKTAATAGVDYKHATHTHTDQTGLIPQRKKVVKQCKYSYNVTLRRVRATTVAV
jgi:hypothetical protein